MLSVAEAAVRANVSESLVRQWVAERALPCYRLGRQGRRGKIRIEDADLEAFLASLRVPAEPRTPRPEAAAPRSDSPLEHPQG